MECKFDVKSRFYALIVLNIVLNSIRAESSPEVNIFEIKDAQDFTERVLNSKEPVVTQFHAPWCGPCKQLGPTLESVINQQNGKIKMAKVDLKTPELSEIANKQGVLTVPFVASYKNGKIVDHMIGMRHTLEVKEFIKKQLKRWGM